METDLDEIYDCSAFETPWNEGVWWNNLTDYVFRASSSPKKESVVTVSGRNAPAASFDDFQESVNDAWDLGDDEFCVISGNVEILSVEQSTRVPVDW